MYPFDMQQRFAEGLATHLTSEANMHSSADSHYDALLATLPADPTMAGLLEPLVLPVEAYQIPAETQRLLAAHQADYQHQQISNMHQPASEPDLNETTLDSAELQHTAKGQQVYESAVVGQQADSEQLTQLLQQHGTGLQEAAKPMQLKAESLLPAAMLGKESLSMPACLDDYAPLADDTQQLHSQLDPVSLRGQDLNLQPEQQVNLGAEQTHVLVCASSSNTQAAAPTDHQVPKLDHSIQPGGHSVDEGIHSSSTDSVLFNTQTDSGKQPSSIIEEWTAHHPARHCIDAAEQAAVENLYATIFPSRQISEAATGKPEHLLACSSPLQSIWPDCVSYQGLSPCLMHQCIIPAGLLDFQSSISAGLISQLLQSCIQTAGVGAQQLASTLAARLRNSTAAQSDASAVMTSNLSDSQAAASAAQPQKRFSRKRQRSPSRQTAMTEATACALLDHHDSSVVDGVPAASCPLSRDRLACKQAQQHGHGLSSNPAVERLHACHSEAGSPAISKDRQQEPRLDPAAGICSAIVPTLPAEPSSSTECNGAEQQSQRQVLASLPSNQLCQPSTSTLGRALLLQSYLA